MNKYKLFIRFLKEIGIYKQYVNDLRICDKLFGRDLKHAKRIIEMSNNIGHIIDTTLVWEYSGHYNFWNAVYDSTSYIGFSDIINHIEYAKKELIKREIL